MASARVLEAEPVLGEAGDRQRARVRAQREDGLLVVDGDRLRSRLDRGDALLGVERGEPSKEQLRVRAHHPQRHDDMARLERARSRLGEHRRVEHEVLEADDRRPALSEQPRDVRACEAAAEDERAASSRAAALRSPRAGLRHRKRRRARVSCRGSGPAPGRAGLCGRHRRARRGDGRSDARREGCWRHHDRHSPRDEPHRRERVGRPRRRDGPRAHAELRRRRLR